MRILVVCQYYAPEPVRISDICEEMVRLGHEVKVITGVPNYPMGEIYEGYQNGNRKDEKIKGVSVHRCFTIERKGGTLKRILNYYSYAFSSTNYALRLKDEFDVVFINQLSPVMMAYAGLKYAKKHHIRSVLYCLDLWPESLRAGGISPKSVIYKVFYRISKKIYCNTSHIVVSSKSFIEHLKSNMNICEKQLSYLPQYAETLFDPKSCAKQKNGTVDLMFAGNIGVLQSLETIVQAASKTKDVPNLIWHIVGDGSNFEEIKKLAQKLDTQNVVFHGRQSIQEMPKFYAMADAMLVTMKADPLLSLTLPGKVQTYMAAGKPIIGAINGEAACVINEAKCGICVPAEDSDALAEAAKEFCQSESWHEWGINAVRFYEEMFSKQKVIGELERVLKNESVAG